MKKEYGFYDYRDKCWMGGDKGPNLYTDQTLARAAATILTEQFQRTIGARRFPSSPVRFKDEVDAPVSFNSACKKLGLLD